MVVHTDGLHSPSELGYDILSTVEFIVCLFYLPVIGRERETGRGCGVIYVTVDWSSQVLGEFLNKIRAMGTAGVNNSSKHRHGHAKS